MAVEWYRQLLNVYAGGQSSSSKELGKKEKEDVRVRWGGAVRSRTHPQMINDTSLGLG